MKNELDKYYTNIDVAHHCATLLDFSQYDLVIEPAGGNGSFLSFLPRDKTIAIDLEPDAQNIHQLDFFDTNPPRKFKYLVIGNPPFGKNSSLAKRFFNHAASFADTVAFILPRTFRKISVTNGLDLNFQLEHEELLPLNSFHLSDKSSSSIACIFQIWRKKKEKRQRVEFPITHKDFVIMSSDHYEVKKEAELITNLGEEKYAFNAKLQDWEIIKKYKRENPLLFSDFKISTIKRDVSWKVKPDFVFRRAGGNAGEICTNYKDCSLQGNVFIKQNNKKVIDIFQRMWDTWWRASVDPQKKNFKWDTAGNPSISKVEMIQSYNKMKEMMKNDSKKL
tara:strand:- start:1405 stop:2409 length:1005 start_codon:yes stop_codon:yes gene_type:complete